ncbi:hypothetical protein ACH5RR_010302 [Cinchona calisaya]|uniref:Uncharacterized protein n=1 Tax=Cinchona calisaya TaxID=153742 RepID=A0ABD3AIC0_9GENT
MPAPPAKEFNFVGSQNQNPSFFNPIQAEIWGFCGLQGFCFRCWVYDMQFELNEIEARREQYPSSISFVSLPNTLAADETEDGRLSLESMQQIYTLEGYLALLLRITHMYGKVGTFFLFSIGALEHLSCTALNMQIKFVTAINGFALAGLWYAERRYLITDTYRLEADLLGDIQIYLDLDGGTESRRTCRLWWYSREALVSRQAVVYTEKINEKPSWLLLLCVSSPELGKSGFGVLDVLSSSLISRAGFGALHRTIATFVEVSPSLKNAIWTYLEQYDVPVDFGSVVWNSVWPMTTQESQIVEDSSEDPGVLILQFYLNNLVERTTLQPKFHYSCLKVVLDVLGKLSKPDVNALLYEFDFQHQEDTFVVAPFP